MVWTILTVIPFVVFGLALFFVFIYFLFAAYAYFLIKDLEGGKEMIVKSIVGLSIIFLAFLAFSGVTYLVKSGEIFNPAPATGEFPNSPMGKFPSGPEFIEIGKYYFSGPRQLKETSIPYSVIYSILCKKDTGYDILEISLKENNKPLDQQGRYSCWKENCPTKQIYVALFEFPQKGYSPRTVINKMQEEINFTCQ